MSLASDTNDCPLVDKVVLETNLGAHEDIDDETQDSSRMPSKRPRLDSESQSVSSPPPQTPDFLNHEDESNLSSSSNLCTKDIVMTEQTNSIEDIQVKEFSRLKDDSPQALSNIHKKLMDITTRNSSLASTPSASGLGTFSDSARTRLPSFSSIMCGSPKPSAPSQDGHAANQESDQPDNMQERVDDSPGLKDLANSINSNGNPSMAGTHSQTIGGSAPVSPGLSYVRTLDSMNGHNINFQRRSSVDQVLLHSSAKRLNPPATTAQPQFSPGKGIELTDSLVDLPPISINTGDIPDESPQSPVRQAHSPERRFYTPVNGGHGLRDLNKVTIHSPVTSPYQNASDNALFNVTSPGLFTTTNSFLETPPKSQLVGSPSKPFDINVGFMSGDLKTSNCSEKDIREKNKDFVGLDLMADKNDLKCYKYLSPTQNMTRKLEGRRLQDVEASTQVTFSELNHPIPSVSPIKDTIKEYDCSKPTRQMRPISQSPNLFNDLESVLNHSEEFAFHSALSSSVENVPAKTPEKLLASVPPLVIMNKKNPSLMFENFEFDKPVDIDNLAPSDLNRVEVQVSTAPMNSLN